MAKPFTETNNIHGHEHHLNVKTASGTDVLYERYLLASNQSNSSYQTEYALKNNILFIGKFCTCDESSLHVWTPSHWQVSATY